MHSLGLGSVLYRRAGQSALVLLLTLMVGCGPGRGTVTGRVLLNGKPLPGGLVTFRPADSKENSVAVPIDEDGNFEAELPAGEVRVAVDNRELERIPASRAAKMPPDVKLPPLPKSGSPAPPAESVYEKPAGRYVAIPSQYYDIDSSGLSFVVKPGPQTQDIQLK